MAAEGNPRLLHAALPMYDWPETACAWDAVWAAIRAELARAGIDAARELRRDDDPHAGWLSPDLVVGHTCGWPYLWMLRDQVTPFARFDFDIATARAGDYHSVFVMRADRALTAAGPRDLAALVARPETIVAINSTLSQSGYRALGECFTSVFTIPHARALITGSHRESVRAIAEGRADIAAVDAVSWRLARGYDAAAAQLTVVTRSADAPGLPLIIANGLARHREAVWRAVVEGVARAPREVRSNLGLRGVVPASDADYAVLLAPPYGNLQVG